MNRPTPQNITRGFERLDINIASGCAREHSCDRANSGPPNFGTKGERQGKHFYTTTDQATVAALAAAFGAETGAAKTPMARAISIDPSTPRRTARQPSNPGETDDKKRRS
jgi:hypothetical protein